MFYNNNVNQKAFAALPLVIVVLIIVVGMGGYLAFGLKTQAPSSTTAGVDTAGWQTYQNEEGGYSFKYPTEWSAATNKYNSKNALFGPGATDESGVGGVEYTGTLSSGQPLSNFTKEFNKNVEAGSISETETVIGGNNAVISILPKASLAGPTETKSVDFEKNGRVFNVYLMYKTDFVKYPEAKEELVAFDQILSTFKFVSPVSSVSSDLFRVVSAKIGDIVSSPIYISGVAKAGWGIFEGQAGTVTLYDGNGNKLGMTLLTVNGDWMQPEVQFATELNFTSSTTADGKLVFKNDNPSGDPARDKTYEMAVKFANFNPGRKMELFYYNAVKDREIADYMPCSRDAVLPVERAIPISQTPIKDAVNLLLSGWLTDSEKAAGFTTEFPLSGFSLTGANLKDGTLTLQFSDPENKSGGGSCRVGLLWAQISKTALQFPEVKQVKFEPEELFQP